MSLTTYANGSYRIISTDDNILSQQIVPSYNHSDLVLPDILQGPTLGGSCGVDSSSNRGGDGCDGYGVNDSSGGNGSNSGNGGNGGNSGDYCDSNDGNSGNNGGNGGNSSDGNGGDGNGMALPVDSVFISIGHSNQDVQLGDDIGNSAQDDQSVNDITHPSRDGHSVSSKSSLTSLIVVYRLLVDSIQGGLRQPSMQPNFDLRGGSAYTTPSLSPEQAEMVLKLNQLDANTSINVVVTRIIELVVAATTADFTSKWSEDDTITLERFYAKMEELARKLVNSHPLDEYESTAVIRLASIMHALRAHLAVILDIRIDMHGNIHYFDPVFYCVVFCTKLMDDYHSDEIDDLLLGVLRSSLLEFKKLLPIIEAETKLGVVPRDAAFCSVYEGEYEKLTFNSRKELCIFRPIKLDSSSTGSDNGNDNDNDNENDNDNDNDNDNVHGQWVTADGEHGPKLVFRNLLCPGGDGCPIKCDQVQRAFCYDSDDGSAGCTGFSSLANSRKHHRYSISRAENPKPKCKRNDYSETANSWKRESGMMVPKKFIRNLTSRGVFALKFQWIILALYLLVIGIITGAILLILRVLVVNAGSAGSKGNNSSSNGSNGSNGSNNSTILHGEYNITSGSIVSSSNSAYNITNTYSNCSSEPPISTPVMVTLAIVVGVPVALFILDWIRVFKAPETSFLEFLFCHTAVTSFTALCRMPCFCPGCVTVALLRARRSVLLAIFGPFASMLGSVGQALAALRACLDCYGSTTCLHRGDLYVVHAFSELQRHADFVVSENIGPYHTSLPPGLPCSNRDGRYYLADDDKAFLVRAMPESSKVAIVATLDIVPNKVGRVTWLTTAIVVEPLSTPICDFKYLA